MKLFLYADETIWAAQPGLLLVAVVALPTDRLEGVRASVERLEATSGRDNRKWAHSLTVKKIRFLAGLGSVLEGCPPVYWRFREGAMHNQIELMATTLADAAQILDSSVTFYVQVDGFKASELHRVRTAFKTRRLHFKKIVGGRDESEPLLRLADALAGFLGDLRKEKPYTKDAWNKLSCWFRKI